MYIYHISYIFVLSLSFPNTKAQSLECYTCSEPTKDKSICQTSPDQVTSGSASTACSLGTDQCCTIHRREYASNKGVVQSFHRGCQSNCAGRSFEINDGPSDTTYITYCYAPLCNEGQGNIAPAGHVAPAETKPIQHGVSSGSQIMPIGLLQQISTCFAFVYAITIN